MLFLSPLPPLPLPLPLPFPEARKMGGARGGSMEDDKEEADGGGCLLPGAISVSVWGTVDAGGGSGGGGYLSGWGILRAP